MDGWYKLVEAVLQNIVTGTTGKNFADYLTIFILDACDKDEWNIRQSLFRFRKCQCSIVLGEIVVGENQVRRKFLKAPQKCLLVCCPC